MAGKKPAPAPFAEHSARASEPWQDAAGTTPATAPGDPVGRVDLQAFERTLKQLWPSSVMLDVWERMHEARRQAWAEHARSLLPRICPGCGASHSLAEVCR